MGNRLSRIYTRTGDTGTTGLTGGTRVPKDDRRIGCMGTLDELNSALGVVLAQPLPEAVRGCLTPVQHRLFDAGGELSMPGTAMIEADDVARLEHDLDRFNADLPALKNFIMPGGTAVAAQVHMARAICRRGEREIVALDREAGDVNANTLRFVNRLSDLLFVIGRCLAREGNSTEVLWAPRAQPRQA